MERPQACSSGVVAASKMLASSGMTAVHSRTASLPPVDWVPFRAQVVGDHSNSQQDGRAQHGGQSQVQTMQKTLPHVSFKVVPDAPARAGMQVGAQSKIGQPCADLWRLIRYSLHCAHQLAFCEVWSSVFATMRGSTDVSGSITAIISAAAPPGAAAACARGLGNQQLLQSTARDVAHRCSRQQLLLCRD